MRVFIAVLVLIFSLQSWTRADDIHEFEIEGMSIGDSLLDFFSEEKIFERKKYEYKYNKIFSTIGFPNENYNDYDKIQIHYKLNDKSKIIYGITGILYFDNKINECLKLKEKITSEFKLTLTNIQLNEHTFNHWADKKNNTKVYQAAFDFPSRASITIVCTDWSEELTKEKGWDDNLKVSILSQEIADFFGSLN